MSIKVGTAGWTIPRDVASAFPADGSGLERYADRFAVAEINSSFHRPHRASTWERWRDSVPESFRFSVKVPKTITHQARLTAASDLIRDFILQANALGDRLAVLLVQLPPKLEFDDSIARAFFGDLKSQTDAQIVCEPRNASWFTAKADNLLAEQGVARVAADPAVHENAAKPGGWTGLGYWRLHGSPVMYRSSYAERIHHVADQLSKFHACHGVDTWCIFDNTASGAATRDALALMHALEQLG
jgi:uncharacterized protein YecE (DUF72 family)